jgi:hypothetical protein
MYAATSDEIFMLGVVWNDELRRGWEMGSGKYPFTTVHSDYMCEPPGLHR